MADLSGYEKDQLRKKFGHNSLTPVELDFGRRKKERLAKKMLKIKLSPERAKALEESSYTVNGVTKHHKK